MKRSWLSLYTWFGLLLTAVSPAEAKAAGELATSKPAVAIAGIRAVGGELVVTVHVATGQRRVKLESRPRLGRGTWTPRAVQWSDGTEGDLTFHLPLDQSMELLRAQGEAEAELGLPESFFSGRSTFKPQTQTGNAFPGAVGGMDLAVAGPGSVSTLNLTLAPNASPTFIPSPGAFDLVSTRAVVESDVWKFNGPTLYFFNQQRGLQVIDVTNPDQPTLRGTLPLAVWGEQMYRLPAVSADGSVWLALLTQQACSGNGSEVLLVSVKDGQPRLAGRLPVRGQIRESRLVGNALYTASYAWFQPAPQPVYEQGQVISYIYAPWESKTAVQGFDLSDPAHPNLPPGVELAANPDAIMATERFLFVATTGTSTPKSGVAVPAWTENGNHSVIVFDISDPHGTVTQTGFMRTAGVVDNKFKLGLNGDVFTAVSQAGGGNREIQHTNSDGTVVSTWKWTPTQAVLETFNLADPAAPAPRGTLTLVTDESLYATRIVGDRAYVVTFHRVDPLWIVDLSNPDRPTVKGELQVPGYSSYLHPLGDRLLALGVEGNRTMIQLFDVADAAHPGLLAKVPLGDNWSWSEGNSDEKAFQVFPDAGLILVPWQGSAPGSNGSRWFQGLQLVDFNLSVGTLKARGVIDHFVQARRATLLGDRVVSVSAQALLTTDVGNRDQPHVVAELELSPTIDRVFVAGDRLLQIRESGPKPPELTLASVSAAELPLASLGLANLPVIGASWHDGRLALLQLQTDEWRSDPQPVTNFTVIEKFQPPLVQTTTNLSVSEVPQPPLISYRFSTNVITYPPLPLDPNPPQTETNVYTIIVKTPQAPLLVTNAIVSFIEIPQPPIRVTNELVSFNYISVRIPGKLLFSTIGVGPDSLRLLGETQSENPTNFYANQLQAVWPKPDVVVWTEAVNNYSPFGWNNWLTIDSGAVSFRTEVVNPSVTPGLSLFGGGIGGSVFLGDAIFFQPGFVTGVWWPGWSSSTRTLLGYDLSVPTTPTLASITRLGEGLDWNSFSGPTAADGKLFFGHRESKYLPAAEINQPVTTNASGSVILLPAITINQLGTWEHHSFLDVVDFADVANPVIRAPVSVPGLLQGTSHGGQVAYVEGSSVTDPNNPNPQLHALAYDGLSASLVASLPLPASGPRPLLVRDDGHILLGRAAASTNDHSVLEVWAVTQAGTFAKFSSVTLSAPVEELHTFGEWVVAPTADQFLQFDTRHLPELAVPVSAQRPCNLSFDWMKADAAPATGLWVPRGQFGLWNIPFAP